MQKKSPGATLFILAILFFARCEASTSVRFRQLLNEVTARAISKASTSGEGHATASASAEGLGTRGELENALTGSLKAGDVSAVSQATSTGGRTSVTSTAISKAQNEVKRILVKAVAEAIVNVQNGADSDAAATSLASQIGSIAAQAVTETVVIVDVEGSGSGAGEAQATSHAVSSLVARGIGRAFAIVVGPDSKATAMVKSELTTTVVAEVVSSAVSHAQSEGGTAVAIQKTVSTAVAKIAASVLARALAIVSKGEATAETEVKAKITPRTTQVDTNGGTFVEGSGSATARGEGTADVFEGKPGIPFCRGLIRRRCCTNYTSGQTTCGCLSDTQCIFERVNESPVTWKKVMGRQRKCKCRF